MDHGVLTRLVDAGAIKGARVVGQSGGWAVLVRHGRREQALTAQRSRQVRVFRRLETLVSYLRGVGIARFDVDASAYEAQAGTRRPDRAAALRQAHEAAAYDTWFRAQVQASLDDPRADVADADARARFAALRTALQPSR